MSNAIVVGAGAIGLSSALALLNDGWKVKIVAEKVTPDTTSDGTAAFWEPFLSEPEEKVLQWSKDAFQLFTRLMQDELKRNPDFRGVHPVSGWEFSDTEEEPEIPRWMKEILTHRYATKEELPNGFKSGVYFETLIVESPYYMKFLKDQITLKGGIFDLRKINSLLDLSEDPFQPNIIVNCSGLGAHSLVKDNQVYPISGQIVKIHAPWIKHFYSTSTVTSSPIFQEQTMNGNADMKHLIYIIPRSDCIVVGGTAFKNHWNTEPSPDIRKRILTSAQPLFDFEAKRNGVDPSQATYKVIKDWVGLRPGRTAIRLEKENIPLKNNKSLTVIHNYGHGGSGMTLSLGCAVEVAKLAKEHKQSSNHNVYSKI